MLHLQTPPPTYFPERLRELLRHGFCQAERLNNYSLGPIEWRDNYGVFENLPFHRSDNPYYFENSAGLLPPDRERSRPMSAPADEFEPGFDRGPVLFTPAFTIFHKGTAVHLLYTRHPGEAELSTIAAFYDGYGYHVWYAELLGGEAVRILEIAGH